MIYNPENTTLRCDEKRTIGFHFDLNPGNILITSEGILKISDFGLPLNPLVCLLGSSEEVLLDTKLQKSPQRQTKTHMSGSTIDTMCGHLRA